MSDKTLLVREGNAMYELFMNDLEPNKFNMKLVYSMIDSKWQNPGEIALEVDSDGNGLTVRIPGKKKFKLDYSEAVELAIVLMEYAASDKNAEKPIYRKYKEEV